MKFDSWIYFGYNLVALDYASIADILLSAYNFYRAQNLELFKYKD